MKLFLSVPLSKRSELERCDRSGKQSFGSFRVIRPTAPEILFLFFFFFNSFLLIPRCQIFVSFVALPWNVRYHSPPLKKLLYKETRQIVCLIRLKVMSRYCWQKEHFCCWPNAPGFLCVAYRSCTWIPEPIFSSWYVPRNTYQSWTLLVI